MLTNEDTAQTEASLGMVNSNVVEVKCSNIDDELEEEIEPFCRLCYGTKYDDSTLIEPCLCKGTVAKVHRQCLEKWLNRIGSKKCDLCLYEFKCEETLRYGLFQSLRVWMRHRNRRRYLLHDFCLFLTMNIITLSMIALLLQAIHHVYTDDLIRDNLPIWYFIALLLAAVLWITIYIMTFVVFISTQILPWFRWWRSVKKISLFT